jgi:adenosylcobinamide kinase / adenosylcobinamide-phosphate guanylyltransferase
MPIQLVGGGSRSGKSRHALDLAQRHGPRKAFLATAQALDPEMHDRIRRHQKDRGPSFTTIEEPLEIAGAVRRAEPDFDVVVIDCLTLWLSNMMMAGREADLASTLDQLAAFNIPCILVTNEVGCGIVPENSLSRRFRDLAGTLNQQAVAHATEAYWMIFGVPLRIK